jgi:hypothetical protein
LVFKSSIGFDIGSVNGYSGNGSTSGGLAPRRPATRGGETEPPVIVRPYYYGPGWTGYWGSGWYAPWRPAYAVGPSTGEVKIDTHLRNASVYVDRGYVGPIDKFKKFHLTPGNHDIELRDLSGETLFKERVQVILNKTIELKPPV